MVFFATGVLCVLIVVLAFTASREPKPTEYALVAEGIYDHALYTGCRRGVETILYFENGTNYAMYYDHSIPMTFPKGTKIRIMENNLGYKLEQA